MAAQVADTAFSGLPKTSHLRQEQDFRIGARDHLLGLQHPLEQLTECHTSVIASATIGNHGDSRRRLRVEGVSREDVPPHQEQIVSGHLSSRHVDHVFGMEPKVELHGT